MNVSGDENTNLLGRWQIESMIFKVDGKSFQANETKLYQANLNQLIWEFQEDNRLDEYQNGNKISQNYNYNYPESEITISGYKLYPEVYEVDMNMQFLAAKSVEISNLSNTYSENSLEANMIQDAVFLLNGQLSSSDIKSAKSLIKELSFKKLPAREQ